MDINSYTNELLLNFLDSFHRELAIRLKSKYGEGWLEKGVFVRFPKGQFSRIEQMLSSPMRSVDMEREPEELFGVEHLSNIIGGDWALFKDSFEDRQRTEVYLSEITELRHNLAHRRQRHLVRADELVRFCHNARVLLQAIGAPDAGYFAGIVDSLTQGARLWGAPVGGQLPPHDEIYDEFVGRPDHLRALSDWFTSDSRQAIVWGYGGAGKSALAFKFAKEIQEAPPPGMDAVIWLTAKRSEFLQGRTRDRKPDFVDIRGFCAKIWDALYGVLPNDIEPEHLISELTGLKCLLIVDDLDTVLDDETTAEFLLFRLRECNNQILYTSRQQVPGIKCFEVPGFEGREFIDFVELRAREYAVDAQECLRKAEAIRSVTGGYPLFVDDLIRYSMLVGVDKAVQDWSQRQGDGAREYALRRQLEHLGGLSADALISVAVSDRPLNLIEIGQLAGVTDEDAEQGVRELLRYRLLYKNLNEEDSTPVFDMNANTRRLTRSTFKDSARLNEKQSAFSAFTGERVPAAKRQAIAVAIAEAKRVLRSRGVDAAVESLETAMTGELVDAPDLHGALGWIHAQSDSHAELARRHFGIADQLGTKKMDPYFHWADMERRLAEQEVGRIPDRELLQLWDRAFRVVEMGLGRCGEVDSLCQLAGYLKGRVARTHEQLNEFTSAHGAYQVSVGWLGKALVAPSSADERVSRYHVYRGLTIAHAGLGDMDGLVRSINGWRNVARGDITFFDEVRRIIWKYPEIERRLPWVSGTDA